MIYLKKDLNNLIIDIGFEAKEGFEKSSVFNSEIKKFIKNTDNVEIIKTTMSKLDLDMVRITEDLIDVLIEKELIMFTDLPDAVQNKLVFKRLLRENLSPSSSLYEEEEELKF